MDLADLAAEALDVVQTLCGDRVVESHEQAADVLEALLQKRGRDEREFASALGVSFEQLLRCKNRGVTDEDDAVHADICRADAVYTWNMLIQRINQAAHWQDEYRELREEAADEAEPEDEGGDAADVDDSASVASVAMSIGSGAGSVMSDGNVKEARAKITDVFTLRLESACAAPSSGRQGPAGPPGVCAEPAAQPSRRLVQRLAARLEAELFDLHPEQKDYRFFARSMAANLRRSPSLAVSFVEGRVPPEWLARAEHEALAPKLTQLTRRAMRSECLKEVRMDEDVAEMKRRANLAGRATDLAPPPPDEDPFR